MNSKLRMVGSLFVAGAAAVAVGTMAHADNINTSGVLCQNYNAEEALDIDYVPNAVRNVATSARSIICSVPRSPLVPGSTSGSLAIDGWNNTNTSTSCTVFAVSNTGGTLGSQSFTETATTSPRPWRHTVSLTSTQLRATGYVSVLCTIPGHATGEITGLTSFQ